MVFYITTLLLYVIVTILRSTSQVGHGKSGEDKEILENRTPTSRKRCVHEDALENN